MAALLRSLDITAVQVVVEYPNDRNFCWHHRLLLHRVADGEWITLTPDHELQRHDLREIRHHVVPRAAVFPQHLHAGGIYAHDPIDPVTLGNFKKLAKVQAALLGAGEPDDAQAAVWRFADFAEENFAQEVPAEVVASDDTFAQLHGHGIAIIEGKVFRAEQVQDKDLDTWKKAKKDTTGDVRVLGVHRLDSGRRDLGFREAVDMLLEFAFTDWPHEGPRCARDFLRNIASGAGNLVSYHSE